MKLKRASATQLIVSLFFLAGVITYFVVDMK